MAIDSQEIHEKAPSRRESTINQNRKRAKGKSRAAPKSIDGKAAEQVNVEVNNAPSYQVLSGQAAPTLKDIQADKLALAEFRNILGSIVEKPPRQGTEARLSPARALMNIFHIGRMLGLHPVPKTPSLV